MMFVRRRGGMTVAAAMLALASIASCTGDVGVTPVAVTSIELSPSTATVRAGSTVTLAARPMDAEGRAVDVRPIVWSSSNRTVATVSSTGVVSALSPGDVRIAASALGTSAVATVTVTARVVAAVVASPSTLTMRVGVSAPVQAQTLDSDGAVLTGRIITWSSSNVAIAIVSAQGIVTGISAGAATILVTSEGRTDQVAVTVTLPPVQTVTVAPTADTLGVETERTHIATLRDATGAVLTGRNIAWSSSNVTIATVSNTGVVTGRAPGLATIAAASEGRVGTSAVVVLARLARTVTLTPATSTLIVGGTQQLTPQVTDSLGNLLAGRVTTFVSDAPNVASVSSNGTVSAIAPGVARITATTDGRSAIATVTVIPEPVVSLTITPATVSLLTGGTQQLTATARAENGSTLTGRTVTWTSGAPNVVRVSASGAVTAVSPGVAIILAVVDDVTASVTITVAAPAVATVTVSPLDPTIAVSASIALTAVLRDRNGGVLTGRLVTWTSSDESVAFVSSTGQVVGFKVGTARITAATEGVSASTTISVR